MPSCSPFSGLCTIPSSTLASSGRHLSNPFIPFTSLFFYVDLSISIYLYLLSFYVPLSVFFFLLPSLKLIMSVLFLLADTEGTILVSLQSLSFA